jgi:SAM-dependent methyltransferase
MTETFAGRENEANSHFKAPTLKERAISMKDAIRAYLIPSENTPEYKSANEYLRNFGLSWKTLKKNNGKILDIGSGRGGLTATAKKRGIEVIAFDKDTKELGQPGMEPFEGVNLILGDALKLHEYFPEKKFDLVLSRRTVIYIVYPLKIEWGNRDTMKARPETIDDIETSTNKIKDRFAKLFSNVRQVLNEGGEFLFDGVGWMDDVYAFNNRSDPLSISRDEITRYAYDYLKKIDPKVSMKWGFDSEQKRAPFFILKK